MHQPPSVRRLVASQWALCGLGLLSTVLVWLLREDLVRSWAEGRADLSQTLQSGGLEAVEASGVAAPAFVPVAVVLFVVVVALIWVLTSFVLLGYGWARLVLTGLLVFMAVATVAGIRTSPPAVFVALGAVSFVIEALALTLLWRRETTVFIAGD